MRTRSGAPLVELVAATVMAIVAGCGQSPAPPTVPVIASPPPPPTVTREPARYELGDADRAALIAAARTLSRFGDPAEVGDPVHVAVFRRLAAEVEAGHLGTAWPMFRQDLAIAARTTDYRRRELELTQSAGRARSLAPLAAAFGRITKALDAAAVPAAAAAFRDWRTATDAFSARWPPGSRDDLWTLPYTLTDADRATLRGAARAIEGQRRRRVETRFDVSDEFIRLLLEARRGRFGVDWEDCASDIADTVLRWYPYDRRVLGEDRDGSMPRAFKEIDAAHRELATAIERGDFRAAKSACERSKAGAEAFDREFPE